MLTTFFDTHCHLDFDDYGQEVSAVIERALQAGVRRMTTIGAGRDVRSAQAAVQLTRQYPEQLVCTVGVHPHDAEVVNDTIVRSLHDLAQEPSVVAIGEIGLDYYYEHSPKHVQQHVFRQFIAMAREIGKPIVVHTRQAAEDTLAVLREENARDVGGIIHCFSEDAAFAKSALDLGFVSSFSGILTFKNATAIREAAQSLPEDAILIETDAPFLAPVPHRGKRNEPAWVVHTAEVLASIRSMSLEDVAHVTTQNALRVFGMGSPSAV
jgi:TatD DNase family protein